MKPPKPFKLRNSQGYSRCMACDKWRYCMIFRHEGSHLILCAFDYTDYWENTDELSPDYTDYGIK